MRTSQVVAYLDSTGTLDLESRSPWPGRLAADESVVPLRVDPLLGTGGGDEPWAPAEGLTVELLDRLAGSAGPTASNPAWDHDAWYRPVHTHAYASGIHVRESAVSALALDLAATSAASAAPLAPTRENAQHLVRTAFLVLFLHQLFHHRVETLGLRLEVVHQRPRYLPYYRDAYARSAGTDDQLEEALANAFVHRSLGHRARSADVPVEVRRLAAAHVRERWTADEPSYREAAAYLTSTGWSRGLGELHARVDEGTATPSRRATWRHLGPDLTGVFLEPAVDVVAVAVEGQPAVLPRADVAPACSGAQMVALLERAGYEQPRRQKGPVLRLTCKGRAVAVVPPVPALPPGATARLLALIDATPADLPELLEAP
jgi:hypothetical protein